METLGTSENWDAVELKTGSWLQVCIWSSWIAKSLSCLASPHLTGTLSHPHGRWTVHTVETKLHCENWAAQLNTGKNEKVIHWLMRPPRLWKKQIHKCLGFMWTFFLQKKFMHNFCNIVSLFYYKRDFSQILKGKWWSRKGINMSYLSYSLCCGTPPCTLGCA